MSLASAIHLLALQINRWTIILINDKYSSVSFKMLLNKSFRYNGKKKKKILQVIGNRFRVADIFVPNDGIYFSSYDMKKKN